MLEKIKASFIWKLIAPLPVLALIGILLLLTLLPSAISRNATENAILSASQTVDQFKKLRGYYTKNIISKVLADGNLKPHYNHKNNPGAIPLPATLIHEMSEILSQNDTSIQLYSAYPFPNRSSRRLDNFQTEAWAFLTRNPGEVFVREEEMNGQLTLRVAVADTMVADACVNCHNSHPETPKTGWSLGDVRGVLEVDQVVTKQIENAYGLSRSVSFWAFVLLVLTVAVTSFISLAVAKPVRRMAEAMTSLSSGDLEVELPKTASEDEVGAMAKALVNFKESAREKRELELRDQQEAEAREAQEREHQVQLEAERQSRFEAEEKTRSERQEERRAARRALARRFEETVLAAIDEVGRSADNLETAAAEMASATHESSAGMVDASDKATAAGGSVDAVAGATEEISASVVSVSDQMARAADATEKTLTESRKATELVDILNTSGQKINDVIKLINDIAEQTNLLALNATIEAARAGDAGKGFAVVASEVKALATQTASATGEISQQINELQSATQNAVQAFAKISDGITGVDEIAREVAGTVSQQSLATQEISSSALSAATGTSGLLEDLGTIKGLAEKAGQSADDVKDAIANMQQQGKVLKESVTAFLDELRNE